jgi:hypothetical protein
VTVEVGGEVTGLASLLADLLEQNLARAPRRRELLDRPSTVAIVAADAGVGATLRIGGGAVRVEQGADRGAGVLVRGRSQDLLELTAAPLRWGLPDLLDPRGRRAIGALLSGRVRVRGLLVRPRQVAGLVRLLSAA